MISNSIIGERIYLRRLTEEDASEEYVRWMNDPEVNQYLESRFYAQTVESTKAFIRSVSNENNYQFGIFIKETGRHIGNIKIGNINHYHKFAEIGFLIGEKEFWGKGIATEAIGLATDYAFNKLGIHKLIGGAYSPNIGSIKSFLKNGYEQEGNKRSQYLCHGEYVDDIIFGKVYPYE